MAQPTKRAGDVVIYDLSEQGTALFKIGSVYVYTRADAEARGRTLAQKNQVNLWLQKGIEVELVGTFEPRRRRGPRS